jgi:hypothetical protein
MSCYNKAKELHTGQAAAEEFDSQHKMKPPLRVLALLLPLFYLLKEHAHGQALARLVVVHRVCGSILQPGRCIDNNNTAEDSAGGQ